MNPKLTAEQRDALQQSDGPVPVQDDETQQVYVLIEQARLEELRRIEDREAIRQGIEDMEAGRVISLAELEAKILTKLRRSNSA